MRLEKLESKKELRQYRQQGVFLTLIIIILIGTCQGYKFVNEVGDSETNCL